MKLIGLACFLTCCVQQYLHAAPTTENKPTPAEIKYMKDLGYYHEPDSSLGQIGHEKNIRQSLMQMQRFAGIPASGLLDDATKKLMKTPRCGMKDFTKKLDNVKRKRRYTLQGSMWRKDHLTWKLTNDNNDGLTRDEVEGVMTKAFNKWEQITNLKFEKLDLSSDKKVDIVVKFARWAHDDLYHFDGPGGTLAHAFYPHNNEGLSGDIHFDDDEVYTINSPSGRSLLWVAVHEIGHSIGLEHSNALEAVMYPWYRGNGGQDFDLNEDDRIGIQNIYGSKKKNPATGVTPTTTTKPDVDVTLPTQSDSGCPSEFKAGFMDSKTKTTYIINNDKAYIISKGLRFEKGPLPVSDLFPGVNTADAIYQKKDGSIMVFDGRMVHEFDGVYGRRVSSNTIQNQYSVGEEVDRIDAAFIWNGNGRTYLFAKETYYRFDGGRGNMDYGYPKSIYDNWTGLPKSIDGVFIWSNKVTYFFKDEKFYRFNDARIEVENDYPRPINPAWTKCNVDRLQDKKSNSGVSVVGSTILSFSMILIAKLLQ